MGKTNQVNAVKITGPYVLDETIGQKVGDSIILDNYGGEHFKDGDTLKIIGFSECKDQIDESVLHRGLYFGRGEYRQVTYLVGVYSRSTGELVDRVSVYPNETRRMWGDHYQVASEARLLKPAIKVLRDAGLENQARILEHQRAEHYRAARTKRRQTLNRRAERDAALARKTIARMSIGKAVNVRADGNRFKGAILTAADQTSIKVSYEGRTLSFDFEKVTELEQLGDVA